MERVKKVFGVTKEQMDEEGVMLLARIVRQDRGDEPGCATQVVLNANPEILVKVTSDLLNDVILKCAGSVTEEGVNPVTLLRYVMYARESLDEMARAIIGGQPEEVIKQLQKLMRGRPENENEHVH